MPAYHLPTCINKVFLNLISISSVVSHLNKSSLTLPNSINFTKLQSNVIISVHNCAYCIKPITNTYYEDIELELFVVAIGQCLQVTVINIL